LTGIFLVIWFASLYLVTRADIADQRNAAVAAISAESNLIGDSLRNFASDLRAVAGLQSLREYIDGDVRDSGAVMADFSTFVREKPLIAQLRLIDRDGLETVRVDRNPDTQDVEIVTDLQNKAERYYFSSSIGLPADGIYISAIDLNVEFGAVEMPWRPMIRLATPVFDRGGATVGIVIVNVALSRMLESFDRRGLTSHTSIQILNADGYWLAGVERDRLWGFMFGRENTLAAEEPALWSRIESADGGEFVFDGRTVIVRTLYPESALFQDGRDGAVVKDDEYWKIVAFVPGVTAGAMWGHANPLVAGASLIVVGLFAYVLSMALTLRREAETEKRRAAEDLERSERMASLGRLVAGVAHELNTPVGNAVTVASTLAEQVDDFEKDVASGSLRRSVITKFIGELRDGTRIILDGLERAHGLIGHFKQVAVDQASEQRREFQLQEIIAGVAASLKSQLRHDGITLYAEIETEAVLDSYPGALSQVLIVLVENCRAHAFQDRAPGTVTMIARDKAEKMLEIEVRDDGVGMPPETLARIFEPFFTTRMGQGGSGLGLSIAFNIVTGTLGGSIRAKSALGDGTSIFVDLPLKAPERNREAMERTYDVG
jgi:signal transduction histidine kinase